MIVWGGVSSTGLWNDGGRYNPASNAWTPVPTNGAPGGRFYHTAVWTGSEMLAWGGYNGSALNDGGRYNPANNSWTPVPTNGAPGVRYTHAAVWSGIEMIVWGGYNLSAALNDGGRFNPTANSWTAVTGAPSARSAHTAVWTGSEMIVWGGSNTINHFNDGGRFNPAANTWTAVTTNGAPATAGVMVQSVQTTGGAKLNVNCRLKPVEIPGHERTRSRPLKLACSATAMPRSATL